MRPILRQEFDESLRDRPLNLWKRYSVMRVKLCLLQHNEWLLFSIIHLVRRHDFSSDLRLNESVITTSEAEESTSICARQTIMPDSVAEAKSMAIGES
jgi:hypothetical protein